MKKVGALKKVWAYAAAGLALLAAGGLVFFAPHRHTVSGDIEVSTSAYQHQPGDACVSPDEYDDVGTGTPVVVQDETGHALATSSLRSGIHDGRSCVFTFTLKVDKAASYRVSIGSQSRGDDRQRRLKLSDVQQLYSYTEMVNTDWAVHLTLLGQ